MQFLLLVVIVLVIGYFIGRSKYRKNIDDSVSGAANWTSSQVKKVTGGGSKDDAEPEEEAPKEEPADDSKE